MTGPTEESPILSETHGRVRLLRLNRPKALNAINRDLARALLAALTAADTEPDIGAIVITGSDRAFAAGADIREMADQGFAAMHAQDWFGEWDAVASLRKPLIAAVAGHALGGGCELALMCDFILAAETAHFGQPEVRLGVMPGMGGTQRLTRRIGQARAMELCLTGRLIGAAEAERIGLVARVVPPEDLLPQALATAATIAEMPLPAVMSIRDAVQRAPDLSLQDGLRYERRLFHALFATADQKEGMRAFVEKRPPKFENR